MHLIHMTTTRSTCSKSCQTNPTNMNPAPTTNHMVAPLRLFHRRLTIRVCRHTTAEFVPGCDKPWVCAPRYIPGSGPVGAGVCKTEMALARRATTVHFLVAFC